jgi:hypothetical protein
MSTREIEKRLAAVEQEIERLKADRAPGSKAHPIHSPERIHGIFENDRAFQEATRAGRKWRDSQHPAVRKSKARRL